jgi:hypothetical protein
VKIINEDTAISENINFSYCKFESIGRMGIEFQNHNDGSVLARYRDISVTNCVFKSIGDSGSFGMGVSLSGVGYGCNVDNNTFDDCFDVALEGVGCSSSSFSHNTFANMTQAVDIISLSGSRGMSNNVIIGNKTVGVANGAVVIRNQTNPVFSDNILSTASAMDVRDTTGMRGSNNIITTTDQIALVFDGTATTVTNNILYNSTFDNHTNATNFSCVRFAGADATNNRLIGCTLYKGTGGVDTDQITSAINNTIIDAWDGATGERLRAYLAIVMSDADYDLNDDQGSIVIPVLIRLTGPLTATRSFTLPKQYERIAVWNNTGQTLTFKVLGGSGETMVDGLRQDAIYNGTDINLI